MKEIKEVVKCFIIMMSVIFLLWVTISFIDINEHNNPMEENYKNYAEWNIFLL